MNILRRCAWAVIVRVKSKARSRRRRKSVEVIAGELGRGPFRIGIVGCGVRGKNHALTLHEVPQVRVVVVTDPSKDAQTWTRRAIPGIETFGRVDDMLAAHPDLDLVVVATTTAARQQIVASLCRHVPRLMIEKPLANSVAEARAIADTCRKANCSVAVDLNRRWSPDYGRIRIGVAPSNDAQTERVLIRSSLCGLEDRGVHLLDLACMLARDVPESVSAHVALLRGPSRSPSNITGIFMIRFKNGGFALVDLLGGAGQKKTTVSFVADGYEAELREGSRFWRDRRAGARKWTRNRSSQIDLADGCFLAGVSQLLRDEPPNAGLEEGIQSVELALAGYLSGRNGGASVELPIRGANESLVADFL
jgi:predicted dehydrogenase